MQKKTSVERKLPGREFGHSTVSKVRIYKQWLNPGVPMAPVCEVWGCPTEDEHCTGVRVLTNEVAPAVRGQWTMPGIGQ